MCFGSFFIVIFGILYSIGSYLICFNVGFSFFLVASNDRKEHFICLTLLLIASCTWFGAYCAYNKVHGAC